MGTWARTPACAPWVGLEEASEAMGLEFENARAASKRAFRLFRGELRMPASFNLSGSCSKSDCPAGEQSKNPRTERRHTVKVMVHLSAAILRLARLAKVAFPSYASRRMSALAELEGFSNTKKTKVMIAKKVVYM